MNSKERRGNKIPDYIHYGYKHELITRDFGEWIPIRQIKTDHTEPLHEYGSFPDVISDVSIVLLPNEKPLIIHFVSRMENIKYPFQMIPLMPKYTLPMFLDQAINALQQKIPLINIPIDLGKCQPEDLEKYTISLNINGVHLDTELEYASGAFVPLQPYFLYPVAFINRENNLRLSSVEVPPEIAKTMDFWVRVDKK